MALDKMQRASRKTPCPVCGKSDWCLIAKDGSAAICSRVQEGSVKRCGDAGWLHILSNRHNRHNGHRCFVKQVCTDDSKSEDFEQIAKQYQGQLTTENLERLSTSLELSAQSLKRLGIGWDGNAYTFPMSDAESNVIGIRRRFPSGHKISATGSKTGLFIPTNLAGNELLIICEGPTDCAAALDLNFDSIGRPNCNSKIEMTAKAARGRKVVIIADNDCPGKTGALKLAERLVLVCPCVRIVFPFDGFKDLREWYQAGLSHDEFLAVIEKTKLLTMELAR